jgi:hypothetical protein
VKPQRFDDNNGDSCGCHNPLGGVVVVVFSALGLRVKTLDLMVSTTAVYPSLASSGALVEL